MIDRDHLDQQTAGDAALQHELLALFLTQIDGLHTVLGSDPLPAPKDLAAILHRVRGAAAAIGALSLAEALAWAESEVATSAVAPPAWIALHATLDDSRVELSRLIAALSPTGLAKAGESR